MAFRQESRSSGSGSRRSGRNRNPRHAASLSSSIDEESEYTSARERFDDESASCTVESATDAESISYPCSSTSGSRTATTWSSSGTDAKGTTFSRRSREYSGRNGLDYRPLMRDNAQLRQDNEQLRRENAGLREENGQLRIAMRHLDLAMRHLDLGHGREPCVVEPEIAEPRVERQDPEAPLAHVEEFTDRTRRAGREELRLELERFEADDEPPGSRPGKTSRGETNDRAKTGNRRSRSFWGK